MSPWIAALCGLLGLVVGWLLTVPLHRFKEFRPKTPRDVRNEAGVEIRAVFRHARCPGCLRDQTPADMIPVVSWIRGCRACGRPVPATVVVPQIALAIAMALTAITFGRWWGLVPFLWFAIVAMAVAVIDARIWLIPWWIPWLGSAVGGAMILVSSVAVGEAQLALVALVSAAVTFGLFFVLWLVAPGRLGFGDVRLAFMIGLFLGWLSPLLTIWGLLLGSLTGVVIGLWSMASRRGSHFAFGPALTVGALAAVWLRSSLLL